MCTAHVAGFRGPLINYPIKEVWSNEDMDSQAHSTSLVNCRADLVNLQPDLVNPTRDLAYLQPDLVNLQSDLVNPRRNLVNL